MTDIRQSAFNFALRIIKLCQQLEVEPGVARTLSWQLLRSGASMGANLEEVQGSEQIGLHK
jgi:four helix bundle protein